VRGINVKDEA